jgi:ribosomal protein L12E/L44/L45/RPP1/RPP2
MTRPAARATKALNLVVQRYARPLGLTGKEMQEALQGESARPRAPAEAAPAAVHARPAGAQRPAAGPWSAALEGTLS